MAASVLICVDSSTEGAFAKQLISAVVSTAAALKPGLAAGQVGAIIDATSQTRILRYLLSFIHCLVYSAAVHQRICSLHALAGISMKLKPVE